jgi:hypothetical protein
VRRVYLVGIAVAVAAVAAFPGAASSAVAVCSSTTSPQPMFTTLQNTAYLHKAPVPVAYPWLWNDGANIPAAVLTSKLGAAFQRGNLANEAGKYTLVCNPVSVPGVTLTATSMYVDNQGSPVPAFYPYIDNGMPIPGVHQVYAAAAPAAG